MITFRITTNVSDDRRVVLTLPPDVPTGEAELVVTVESPVAEAKQARPHLADRAAKRSPRNGKELARYPLRGSVVRYEQPTEPVAEAVGRLSGDPARYAHLGLVELNRPSGGIP
jgi:hypothetical protein